MVQVSRPAPGCGSGRTARFSAGSHRICAHEIVVATPVGSRGIPPTRAVRPLLPGPSWLGGPPVRPKRLQNAARSDRDPRSGSERLATGPRPGDGVRRVRVPGGQLTLTAVARPGISRESTTRTRSARRRKGACQADVCTGCGKAAERRALVQGRIDDDKRAVNAERGVNADGMPDA